ncbi:MAG: hypothetical protein AAF385_16295, partial [Pseudomonadota bacterium]
LCRLFSGRLPEWPFEWPVAGMDRMRRWLTPESIAVIEHAMQVNPKKRIATGVDFERAFKKAEKSKGRAKARRKRQLPAKAKRNGASWRGVQHREFRQRYGKALDARFDCRACNGPVSEAMQFCPWCHTENPTQNLGTDMASRCPHCDRGVKKDWRYCSWCYGRGFEAETNRRYSDRRYTQRCASVACGGPLMSFMRSCPWCHTKVKRKGPVAGSKDNCTGCGWGIAAEYWNNCAWCGKTVKRGHERGR